MRVRALGQAGFVLAGSSVSLAIDPYLSNAIAESGTHLGKRFVRLFPPPIPPTALAGVAAVLLTHAHDDHCDPATLVPLASAAPGVQFIGPSPVIALLREHGIAEERMHLTRVGTTISLGANCTVTPIPAAHYAFDADGEGEPAYLGYLVELDGTVCYHSGDTILYDGLAELLRKSDVEVALLPVNGRDAAREALGITGNLEPGEAFALAQDIGARVVIPMHNDLFEINRRDLRTVHDALVGLSPGIQVVLLPPGGEMEYCGERST